MKYVSLGRSGLRVSQLCLGCMSFGTPGNTRQPWAQGESDARPFFQRAVDAGINFFDTANVYSWGSSEEITGKLVRDLRFGVDFDLDLRGGLVLATAGRCTIPIWASSVFPFRQKTSI